MIKIYQTKALFRIEYELIVNITTFLTIEGWSQEFLSGKMGLA
ncbi:hypothetical protein ABE545_23355 [Sphingobacterium faecium]